MKVRKMMVPVAFSRFSRGLFNYAVDLAMALDAELLVVHVINERDIEAVERISSYGYAVDTEEYLREIMERREEKLNELVKDCPMPRERMRFISKVGKPAVELLRLAVKENVDMIVMGIKGRTDLRHAFTGSVAEKLFRRSPVTIVSYRDPEHANRLRKRITKLL